MVSADGQSICFHESKVRVMGRQAAGVMGMRLREGDEAAGMDAVSEDDSHILIVTENGYGKRTTIDSYRAQGRYGLGVKTLKRTARKGPVIAARCIREADGIMLISRNGIVLRTRLSEISETGRNTEGVTLMNLDRDDEVAGIAIMRGEEPGTPAAHEGHLSQQNGREERSAKEAAR